METEQLCVENLILESRLSVFHAWYTVHAWCYQFRFVLVVNAVNFPPFVFFFSFFCKGQAYRSLLFARTNRIWRCENICRILKKILSSKINSLQANIVFFCIRISFSFLCFKAGKNSGIFVSHAIVLQVKYSINLKSSGTIWKRHIRSINISVLDGHWIFKLETVRNKNRSSRGGMLLEINCTCT